MMKLIQYVALVSPDNDPVEIEKTMSDPSMAKIVPATATITGS